MTPQEIVVASPFILKALATGKLSGPVGMLLDATDIDAKSTLYPYSCPDGPRINSGFLAPALRKPDARMRNAMRTVDLPALLGPTITLKCLRCRAKCSNALKRRNSTLV